KMNRDFAAGFDLKKPAYFATAKKNLVISPCAGIFAPTQNRMSACCIPSGLARCDGKRTWKTPKAAKGRKVTGRWRQGARTARSPGAARVSVAGNPATRTGPLSMSSPARPERRHAQWKPATRRASESVAVVVQAPQAKPRNNIVKATKFQPSRRKPFA